MSLRRRFYITITRKKSFTIIGQKNATITNSSKRDTNKTLTNGNGKCCFRTENILITSPIDDYKIYKASLSKKSILKYRSSSHITKLEDPNKYMLRTHKNRRVLTLTDKGEPLSNNSSIIHADDSVSTRLFAQWLTKKYSFSIDKFIHLEESLIDELLEDKKFDYRYTFESNYTNYLIYNEKVMIIITQKKIQKGENERSEAYFELFATNIDIYHQYYKYIIEKNKLAKKKSLLIEYYAYSTGQYGLDKSVEYFEQRIFAHLRDVYYTPYLDVELLFEQYLNSKSVILQLTGKPGLGKSKLISLFIKYLAEHLEYANEDNVIKIARPANSEVLSQEDFWVELRQKGIQALILDDVDYILQKRNEVSETEESKIHNEIIRKLLTFTDGITSQKCKILISTNLEYNKIDSALMRDFRLFDSIELRPLKYAEALKIWCDEYQLLAQDFKKQFQDKDNITAAVLAKTIEMIEYNNNMQDKKKNRSYIKEDGISKIESLRGKKNKIGII